MRTRFLLSLIAAMLLQFTTVMADTYTEGLTKLFDNGVMSMMFNTSTMKNAVQVPGFADYMNGQFKDDAVEFMAPFYRNNMSEKEFNQMIDFYSREDVLQAQKRIFDNMNSSDSQELVSLLAMRIQELMQGQKPDPVPMPTCDPKFTKEMMKYFEINNTAEMSKNVLNGVKNATVKILKNKMPADNPQMSMANTMIDNMMGFLGDNIVPIAATQLVKSTSIDDLKLFNSIENMPFYNSYRKANIDMSKNMQPFMEKVMGRFLEGKI